MCALTHFPRSLARSRDDDTSASAEYYRVDKEREREANPRTRENPVTRALFGRGQPPLRDVFPRLQPRSTVFVPDDDLCSVGVCAEYIYIP